MKILKFLEEKDLSKHLTKDEQIELVRDCVLGLDIDKDSRKSWEDQMQAALKLAKQVAEPKNFPWPGCSNIIYPITTIAANMFAARISSEVIQDNKIVKIGVFGQDPEGIKKQQATRVIDHMSWQFLVESDTWESDFDKMLHILPLVGVCYFKLYYSPLHTSPQADFCNPKDIIVNHNTASLQSAERITHRFYCNRNQIIERIRSGYYNEDLDIDNLTAVTNYSNRMQIDPDDNSIFNVSNQTDSEIYEFYEQHCYVDLDGDGYKEPYIVVFHADSSQLAGIYPRYGINSIKTGSGDKIQYIKPDNYFVDFHFLPSPDGGFHSVGYGHLLYPLNKAINTLFNQLVDSGTLANSQSGVIGRQLKIKGGNIKTQMGELVPVDAGTTGKVQDNIFLFPFKEPSPVLLQLLGLLIDSCKEIASINDILTGKAPAQNSPASTVFELSNNGLKLYSNIAKRLYRSLKRMFKLMYELNGKYLDPEAYTSFHDAQGVTIDDYKVEGFDISPVSDPNMSADMQRLANAQALSFLAQNPMILQSINIPALAQEFFEALRIPQDKIQKLVLPPDAPKPPDPNMMKIQIESQKAQMEGQIEQMKLQLEGTKVENEKLKLYIKSKESEAKVKKMNADATNKLVEAQIDKQYRDRELDIQEKSLNIQEKKIHADIHKEHIKAAAKPKKTTE